MIEKNRNLTLTFKRSKSAILFGLQNFDSRTVRDREMVSIEVVCLMVYLMTPPSLDD